MEKAGTDSGKSRLMSLGEIAHREGMMAFRNNEELSLYVLLRGQNDDCLSCQLSAAIVDNKELFAAFRMGCGIWNPREYHMVMCCEIVEDDDETQTHKPSVAVFSRNRERAYLGFLPLNTADPRVEWSEVENCDEGHFPNLFRPNDIEDPDAGLKEKFVRLYPDFDLSKYDTLNYHVMLHSVDVGSTTVN